MIAGYSFPVSFPSRALPMFIQQPIHSTRDRRPNSLFPFPHRKPWSRDSSIRYPSPTPLPDISTPTLSPLCISSPLQTAAFSHGNSSGRISASLLKNQNRTVAMTSLSRYVGFSWRNPNTRPPPGASAPFSPNCSVLVAVTILFYTPRFYTLVVVWASDPFISIFTSTLPSVNPP